MIHQLLSVRYPIIQAPMLGVTTTDMVAAAANAGVLGSLPVGGLSPDKTRDLIRAVKSKTEKPFSVNLFAHSIGTINGHDMRKAQEYLKPLYVRYGIPFDENDLASVRHYNHEDLIDVLLEEQIKSVSFTFGNMKPDIIQKLQKTGTVVLGTATSINEALALSDSGVDAIVVQGIEAGGHRGTFMHEETLPQIGLFSLLPQVVDRVKIPVVAAGGIFDHRTVKAALMLGASGVQIGSVFLASDESDASESYKHAVQHSTDTSTALTKNFSGRWARGIQNAFMEDEIEVLPYPYQNTLTSPLRAYAKTHDIGDLISMWAGQSASAAKRASCAEILRELIESLARDNISGFAP